MNKKQYQKPTMQVIELQHSPQLLESSADQWLNYIPGQPGTEEYNAKA